MATYNYSSYDSLIDDIFDEVDDPNASLISREAVQGYILQACQKIAQRYPVKQKTDLRLLVGQSQYFFSDSTVPVTGTGTLGVANLAVTGVTSTGTGTLSTVGKDVTGVATLFLTELAVGKMIVVGTEKKMVSAIASNLLCTIDGQFDTDLSASAFTYSTTKFTKEINTGSTLVIGGVSRVVDEVTNAYNLTVTLPYTATQASQTFTVDTVVTEIPTKFFNISEITRLEGIVPRPVDVVSNDLLQERKQAEFGIVAHSNLNQPLMASVWQNISGNRYLEIFPECEADKTITLYGFIQVNPRTYSSVALTANIPLTQEFEPSIKEFAKYRIFKKIKNNPEALEALGIFNQSILEMIRNIPTKVRVKVETA